MTMTINQKAQKFLDADLITVNQANIIVNMHNRSKALTNDESGALPIGLDEIFPFTLKPKALREVRRDVDALARMGLIEWDDVDPTADEKLVFLTI